MMGGSKELEVLKPLGSSKKTSLIIQVTGDKLDIKQHFDFRVHCIKKERERKERKISLHIIPVDVGRKLCLEGRVI